MSTPHEPPPDSGTANATESEPSAEHPPPPPPPPPPPRSSRTGNRRLYRSTEDKMFSGVAGGLGEYANIDTLWVRAAFVALTFLGGAGIVAYAVVWFFMILEEQQHLGTPLPWARNSGDPHHRRRQMRALVIIVAALLAVSAWTNISAFGLGVMLLVVGAFLLWDRQSGRSGDDQMAANSPGSSAPSSAPPSSPSSPSTSAAGASPTGTEIFDSTGASTVATLTTPAYGGTPTTPYVAQAFAPEPVKRRPRDKATPIVRLVAVGLAALATATVLSLNHADVVDLDIEQLLAVPFIVLGLGIFAGAWIGRTAVLLIPAILLLVPMSVAGVANTSFSGGAGAREYHPTNVASIQGEYRLGAGKMVIDLSKVQDFTPITAKAIDAQIGAGELVIVIPKNVYTTIGASAGIGLVEALGRQDDGHRPTEQFTYPTDPTTPTAGALALDVRVGLGHVVITDDPNISEAQL